MRLPSNEYNDGMQALAHARPGKRMSTLLGVVVGSAAVLSGLPTAGAEPSDPVHAKVTYQLSGSGVAGYVTYQTDNGQLHATNVTLPWSMQVTRMATVPSFSAANTLSAQSAGPGALTCTIKVDGNVVTQNTATGDPARVLCENHEGRGTTAEPGPST
jgi:hypothetical protein